MHRCVTPFILLPFVLAFGPGISVPAQSLRSYPVVAADSGASVHRLGDGIYVILHEDAVSNYPDGTTNWPHGNTGVVVGAGGILVVDSDFFPSRADADIRLLRRLSSKPVRYLVNTHWHGDHTHGNAAYRKAFPGLQIVSARANGHFIALNQARFPLQVVAESSAVRRLLAAHVAEYDRGSDSAGRPLPEAQRRLLHKVIQQQTAWLAEFASIEVAPPTRLFDSTLAIDLGGRVVQLRNWGRGNSPADVTAWLPAERVLFTGDVVVSPVPYVFGAYPGPWIGVLRSLERLPVRVLIPGHGPVLADHSHTRAIRELFETAARRMDSLLRLGRTQLQAQQQLDLSDLRQRFVKDGDVGAEAMWRASIVEGLTERTYQCVVGYRC